jgi:hypothetical protein
MSGKNAFKSLAHGFVVKSFRKFFNTTNVQINYVSYKIWITNITESQFHEYDLKKEAKLLSTCTYTRNNMYIAVPS